MPDEKKGITVKVDAALHAEVKQYLESRGMTMADFVTLALTDELHPKMQMKEEKNMGNMRTLAFQVPEDLFQRIKGYLQRNNMTQKEFVIGLIERELDREQAVREGAGEALEAARKMEEGAAEDGFKAAEESEDYSQGQGETVPEGISEAETEESKESEDSTEEQGTAEGGLETETGESGDCAEDQEESATEDSLEAETEESEGGMEEQEAGTAEGGPEAESEAAEESEGDVEEEGTTESGMEADPEEMEEPYGAEAGDGESEDENESEDEDAEEGMGFTMGM